MTKKQMSPNVVTMNAHLDFYKYLQTIKKSISNLPIYIPNRHNRIQNSPLLNKHIVFLGSSITAGWAAKGYSFVDYLRAEDGVIATKEAISGTTLAGAEPSSYVSRLINNVPLISRYDLFVCQLSTNDGAAHKPLGRITPEDQRSSFDTRTTLGAIEFILSYVEKNWAIPILFYTCVQKNKPSYAQLVTQLKVLQHKWHFELLDLWSDPFVAKENAQHPTYMADNIHPTMQGYKKLWTPIFRKKLVNILP